MSWDPGRRCSISLADLQIISRGTNLLRRRVKLFMRRLVLCAILALAFTCAISLTVPSHYSHSTPGSLSEQLLQRGQIKIGNPLG